MSSLLILGAGYVGAALAERALADGHDVTLADNWNATRRSQLDPLAAAGARVEDADIRSREDVARLLDAHPDRLYLLAAQASRPVSERDPDYTEETNVLGVRRVAEALAERGGPPVVFGSSLHVYGGGLSGEIGPDHPYGQQGDLAHLSKVYGELCLALYARRAGFGLALLRLAIVYGASPVEHAGPENETVVNKFRRLAAAGERLPVEGGGHAVIGAVDVRDAVRVMLAIEPEGIRAENVVAETVTVADVAALARGEQPADDPAWRYASDLDYEHRLADYLRA